MERVRVEIRTHRDLFPIDLFDQSLRAIARGYGRLQVELEPGLYLARCEAGGPAAERVLKVEFGKPIEVNFEREELYRMPSSAPVSGTVTRHEFYSEPAARLATAIPFASFGGGARLSLFASRFEFARHQDWSRDAMPVSWGEVALLDQAGEVVVDFLGNGVGVNDTQSGWAAFPIGLNPGGYFLRWPAPESESRFVSLPIWIPAGWNVFVFASAIGESSIPKLSTVSIHMSRLGEAVDPYDSERSFVNGGTEFALASLRTGRPQLSSDQIRRMLAAKFQNPMLGILGGHMLLAEKHPDRELFQLVCHNLATLVPDHPDLIALELLGEERLKIAPAHVPATGTEFPPMLHDGLLALDRAEWRHADREFIGGAARLARLRLLPEGPWTTFRSSGATADGGFPAAEMPSSELLLSHSASLNSARAFLPIEIDEFRAMVDAQQEVNEYIAALQSRGGAVRPEQLRWAGLGPKLTELSYRATRS